VPSSSPAFVTVARIVRPHGLRGETASEILTDFPERLKKLKFAFLWDGRGEPRCVRVQSCWLSPSRGGQAIFHFEGSNSIDDARRLTGLQVQVPFAERAPLPKGTYYVTDLVGCEVWQGATLLGCVREVQTLGGGTPLLVVETPSGGELLVPLAEEFCLRIDEVARRIEVRLPEGLLDLNSPSA
jgi:16S rRNA processing protein RimM